MRSNVYMARNAAWAERQRQVLAAGLVSEHFPGVQSIVVTMNYNRGRNSAMLRTLSFYPGSPAFFKVSAPGDGGDVGHDLTGLISGMVSAHRKSAKGELAGILGDGAIARANVDYEVAISYS